MKLRYTPAAICDLDGIEEYIRDTLMNPDAASDTISSIAKNCALLKEQPRMGPALRDKLGREIEERCLIVGKYIVIYAIEDAVSVLRVLDTRTDYVRILFSAP